MWCFCFLFAVPILLVSGENILFLAGVASPSHALWNFRIIDTLSEKGHNVTVLQAGKWKANNNNTHIIFLEEDYEAIMVNLARDSMIEMRSIVQCNWLFEIWSTFFYQDFLCDTALQSPGFRTLLEYPDDFKFDLIINDLTCGNCLLGFLHKFNYPPMVGVSAFKYTVQFADIMGGHYFTGYIPRHLLQMNSQMSFLQRSKNILATTIEFLYNRLIFLPACDRKMAKYYNRDDLPSVKELQKNHAIALLNVYPATDFPIPLPPSIQQVGGLQITKPKPLPRDLESFINKSKRGTVLVSFGTNVNKLLFLDKNIADILAVIKSFPEYNFLWKFQEDVSNGTIPNLMITQWIPQNDVLAHPKLKAFVTHGGGLSIQETTWYGVPIVVVPFYGDQTNNAYRAVAEGIGIQVDILTMTAENLGKALRNVLQDQSYSNKLKLLSKSLKDRPMEPLNTAIWWIEYVLRHPNPTHLRSPVLDLGYLKANNDDIHFVGVLLLLVVLYVCMKVFCKWFSRKKTKRNGGKLKRN